MPRGSHSDIRPISGFLSVLILIMASYPSSLTSRAFLSTQNRGFNITIEIWTRSFCSVECLLVELSADIDYIYKDLTEDGLLLSISCSRLVFIQQRIVCGLYVLSPLEMKIIKKVDLTQYLSEKLSDLPDIQFWTCADPA